LRVHKIENSVLFGVRIETKQCGVNRLGSVYLGNLVGVYRLMCYNPVGDAARPPVT
jgi:hypothetical protein